MCCNAHWQEQKAGALARRWPRRSEVDNHERTGIRDAFRNKRVLVVGATGFLGKLIVAALLREAPEVAQITLLIRGNRRGDRAARRVANEILATPLFDHLRDVVGARRFARLSGKLAAVTGDVAADLLGMESAAYRRLAGSVDLIVNSAASVDFREALDRALATNTRAVERLAELAAPRRVPILHISTCFVNSFKRGVIDESVHAPRGIDPVPSDGGHPRFHTDALLRDLEAAVAEIARRYPDPETRHAAMVALGRRRARAHGWNDAYTLTKWLAEQRLLARRPHGPLTILRPSIIESTAAQPFAGWLEGINVADAVIYAFARRGLTVFPARKHRVLDLIPADRVVNGVLLAGAELLAKEPRVRIYQCASGADNPLTIGALREHVVRLARAKPDRFPRLFARRRAARLRILWPPVFRVLAFSTELALRAADALAVAVGRRGQRAPRFRRLRELVALYAFYAAPNYVFCNRRLRALHAALPAEHRHRVPVDVAGLDWKVYIEEVHIPGLHRFALKGAPERESAATFDAAVEPVA